MSRARKTADDRPADVNDRCTAGICKQWVATRYQDTDGNVVYGGRTMGPPPHPRALR